MVSNELLAEAGAKVAEIDERCYERYLEVFYRKIIDSLLLNP